MNTNVLNGAIIGFGKLGLLHLSQFQSFKNINIKYICEYDDFVKKNLDNVFRDIKIYKDYKQIPLNNLNFVVVTTPTDQHFDIISFFLKKKVSVFSEKPLVTTYKDALTLKDLSIKNKTCLFTGYMYEHYDTFKQSIDLIKKKKILGDIFFVKAEMYVSQYTKQKKLLSWRFNKKKSGGGLVITQTSHLIYFLTYLFGESSQVKSYLKNIFSQNNIEDYAHIILGFKKNICASIDASWSAINYRTPYLKIFFEGNNGNMTLTEDRISLFLKEKTENFSAGNNVIQIPEIKCPVSFDVAGSHYALQANHFINLLIKKKVDMDNLNTSVETQKIIENIYKDEIR
jgi:predicted dehydrogenase